MCTDSPTRPAWPVAWGVAVLLLGLGGCASQMHIKALATGQADRAAYELNGRNLDALRREARQLCPSGGEVLRQSAAGQRPEAVDGRLQRWWGSASAMLTPPQAQAQLLVLCAADPALTLAASGQGAALANTPVLTPQAPAPAPIGPVTAEW